MTLVTSVSTGILIAGGVLKKVLARRAGARVTVAVAVHDVTAHTEVVILLGADVEVDAGILRRGHATVTTEALETTRGTVAKAQVVHVIATTQDGELVTVTEVVDHQIARIAVIGAITGIDSAKPPVVHAFFHGQVDDGLVIAVVNAREACQVTLAVNDLQLVDHLGRDVFAGHSGVIAEELLAVDKDFLHFLAIGRDLAVTAHFHAGQTLQEVLDHGIGLGLIGIGIELYGVFLNDNRALDTHNNGLLKHDGIGIHRHHADIDVATILTHTDVLNRVIVTKVREFQQVMTRLHPLNIEYTVKVGGSTLDHRAVLVGPQQSHGGFNKGRSVLRIKQNAIDYRITRGEWQHTTQGKQY